MTVIQDLAQLYSRRRFACLFSSLLITMVAAPILAAMGIRTIFMEALLALNILAVIFIILLTFRSYVPLGLMVLVLAMRGGYAVFGYRSLLMTSQGVIALICLISIYIMVRHILSEGSVTSERLFAALNVYLMIGITSGVLFNIFEEQWPGSLSLPGSSLPGSRRIGLAHTLYFSFVTLGTLGYGDIIPISGPARALAVTEALVGQMYLVVVVARLVGLYRGSTDRDDPHGMGGGHAG